MKRFITFLSLLVLIIWIVKAGNDFGLYTFESETRSDSRQSLMNEPQDGDTPVRHSIRMNDTGSDTGVKCVIVETSLGEKLEYYISSKPRFVQDNNKITLSSEVFCRSFYAGLKKYNLKQLLK